MEDKGEHKSGTGEQELEDYGQKHREIQAVRSEYPKEKRFNGSLEKSWRQHCREFLAFVQICDRDHCNHINLAGSTVSGQALV
jgi:hypothetical protein